MEVIQCPSGKIGFRHKVDAAAKLATHRDSPNPRKPVRIYLCPKCSGWHLTATPYRSAAERDAHKRGEVRGDG